MRKVFLAILAVILILPVVACDSGGDSGGGATEASGLTISRTAVAYNKWVNSRGISVPYSSFGVTNVSVGRGRGLPEGATVIVVTKPAHGTLSKNNTYYTPTAGYVGVDSFTFKLADSSGKVHPQVCKITFKRIDAEPPVGVGYMKFPITAGDNKYFFAFAVESPGGIESFKINSQSLTATGTGTPEPYVPTCRNTIGDYYAVALYGNFTGCTGNWVYDINITFTDPAGNSYTWSQTGVTEAIN